MDKAFLNKIQQIILEHLEDDDLNVETLAFEIGLSRSQLLRKVKALTGRSVNQFIRETRLQEAAKLIQKDEFTASEIAYKVGFSSPSYFNKCFHDYFGITPGDYREQSEEEIKKIVEKANAAKTNFFKKPKVLFSVIVFLTALFITSFFINRDYLRKNKLQSSIAVLYFDDMSSEKDTQWFCDGITDEIYTNLSKLKNLKVISRTSVKRYKNSDKSIPKIAKELDVSYILEGSVKKYNDMFRITVKLINSYDEPVWSQEYDEKIENVLKIQRGVSKNIVNQLHIAISPEEEKLINTSPTDNLKAYEYYIKARNFAEKGTKEYFDVSIDHYQQAIDLDPNFADAYAEMAQTYLYNHYVDETNWDQNKNKASILIDQALKIDPNCAKAYAAKAKLNLHYNKWGEIKDNFERALKLNPNDPLIHRDMAFYYSRGGSARDMDKSLYHINKAIELDPFSSRINERKIFILLNFSRLTEAEAFYKNNRTLFSEEIKIDIQNYFIRTKAVITGLEQKDMMESIKFLQKKIQEDPQNPGIYSFLGEIYNGVLNDNINNIKYNKKAYTMDSLFWSYTMDYALALVEGKKFKEAERLMNSKNYRNLMSDSQQLDILSRYYYYKEDYDAAMKCVNDSLMPINHYNTKILILAQQGNVKGIREILNNRYIYDFDKAKVFAILEERDSMYYYIDKIDYNSRIRIINGCKEIDPYRKEERYKAFLKKNYFPITHWNE